jgi:hypothetical protein
MVRFNLPPGWPSPPEGWRPPPNWKPDPKWPQPPADWQLWVDEDASHSLSHEGKPAPTPGVLARPSFADRMRGKWGWAAAALVCLLGLIAGGFAEALIFGGLTALILGVVAIIRESRRQGVRQRPGTLAALIAGGASVFIGGIALPSENAPVTNTPSSMATSHPPQPPPTSEPTPSPTTKKSGQPAQGSSATFKHFKITVSRITQDGSRVRMLAKVCVRSLPLDPQGNRTRISWDPWSIRAGSKTIDPSSLRTAVKKKFPPDATYRVGQCASGWIPFTTDETVTRILYANGVGDRAVWDATDLSAKPKTETTEPKPAPRQRPKVDRAAKDYRNCTALNRDYPHGVGRPDARDKTRNGSQRVTNFEANRPLYDANSESDRDGDGIACEEH